MEILEKQAKLKKYESGNIIIALMEQRNYLRKCLKLERDLRQYVEMARDIIIQEEKDKITIKKFAHGWV